MAAQHSQKAWLSAAKRTLSKTFPNLTWDGFADMAGIDRCAFKTYRMPEDSSDFRKMPPLAESAVKRILEDASQATSPSEVAPTNDFSHLVTSLAALVMRQARLSLVEAKMISGNTRRYGMPVGLTPEDRKAMALVSKACLVNGLHDYGAEIHQLLWQCTRPLEEWLPIDEVRTRGYAETRFIHGEDGTPTAEAEELAHDFGSMTASIEEQLFTRFIEVLGRFPEKRANQDYTKVREFVVRNPVVESGALRKSELDVSSQIWLLMQQQFYEPVPEAWNLDRGVPICAHCGNAMRQGKAGLICRTHACASSLHAKMAKSLPAHKLMRVTRGIRQYWIEPGLDEIRLYDTLRELGLPAELYPYRDRVDVAVGDIGIDLKAYTSPEILGHRFRRSIGGLAFYPKKWVVVPDWLIVANPSYMERLRSASSREDLRFMKLSEALKEFQGLAHA